MRVSKRALIAIAAGFSVGLSGVIAGSARAAGSVPQVAARPAATGYSEVGALDGVAAASNGSAWAVGYAGLSYSSPKILMLHWNGKVWSRVTSPSVLATTGELAAITVVSAKSAWAVGYTGVIGTGRQHSLLLHWNGKAWSQVTSPAPVTGGNLAGIAATAKSGWAVGYVNTNPSAPACCAGAPLVFRWSGSKWSRPTTKLGRGSGLNGVAITAVKTAWAIGGPTVIIAGGLAKWNGGAWSWATNPVAAPYSPLTGIAAGPGGTAFIVGDNGSSNPGPPLSARWNGKTWQKATVIASNSSQLSVVAFAPGGSAWAAGDHLSASGFHTLVMRWNGRAWTTITSPPGTREMLDGLAFSASNYGWAVGYADSTAGSAKTAILHWNGKAWS